MAKISWEDGLALEQRIAWIIREMEIGGVTFDIDRARYLVKDLESRKDKFYSEIRPYLSLYVDIQETKINGEYRYVKKIRNKDGSYSKSALGFYNPELLGGPFSRVNFIEPKLSQRQELVKQLLREGWKPKEKTEKGFPQLTIKGEPVASLKTMGPFGESLAEWYVCNHRQGQIQGFIDKVRRDGKLTPGNRPCATNTFRSRHSVIANLPRVSSFYGKEIRSLMTVPDGYSMVGADLSGLELRLLAHYMRDPTFIELILNGDVHTYNQNLMGLSTRDQAKTAIYGFLYGSGDAKFGSIIGGGSKEGKQMKARLLKGLPALSSLLKRVQSFSSKRGWLPSLDNRKVYLRSYEGKILTHTALNTLLQSTAAIISKRWIQISYDEIKKRGLDASLCIFMHDELQWQVKNGFEEEVGNILISSAGLSGEYYNTRIPMDAEYKIGRNWADTH